MAASGAADDVTLDIVRLRLRNQRLAGPRAATPEEVVGWLGAVQAQDYAGANWAVALRTRACRDADIERALAAGRIVRTHVLRPTWHFVLARDLRWLLALTAPRVKQQMAYQERRHGVDARAHGRAQDALRRALAGGKDLPRRELAAVLDASGLRLAHLVMRAELDAVICSGSRPGTYALVDDRIAPAPALDRDDALGRLARRYFASHGPALAHDFAWWSGLTVADARRAIEIGRLSSRDGYWFAEPAVAARGPEVKLALAARLGPAEQRALDGELARLARFTSRGSPGRSRAPSRPARRGRPATPRRARSRRGGRDA